MKAVLLPKPICIHALLSHSRQCVFAFGCHVRRTGRSCRRGGRGKKNLENNQKAVQVEMSFPTLHAAAAFDWYPKHAYSSDALWFALGEKVISDNQLCLSFLYRFTLIYIIPSYISLSGPDPLDLSLCYLWTCDIVVNVFVFFDSAAATSAFLAVRTFVNLVIVMDYRSWELAFDVPLWLSLYLCFYGSSSEGSGVNSPLEAWLKG